MMAETRSKTVIDLVGEPQETFDGRVLPTMSEVRQVYFYQHKNKKLIKTDAVQKMVMEVCEISNKARIPTAEQRSIVRKL